MANNLRQPMDTRNKSQLLPVMFVQLCRIQEDPDSIIKVERIEGQYYLNLYQTAICIEGLGELSGEKRVYKINSYKWMTLGKRLLAFYPLNESENGHEINSFCISFATHEDLNLFHTSLSQIANNMKTSCSNSDNMRKRPCPDDTKVSEFDSRTEEGSALQYFQFYGSLFQQQNMMQDFTRTSTYQRAIHENHHDFRNKVVLDVGAGSGILSFFAAQAGAKRVYAVEASSMADHCKTLVSANGLDGVIKVITGKIEEVELPENVDVIISEPMGYMLVNERMLESYVFARKLLRNGGRMFPSQANLHIALFSDEQLYLEQSTRASFWAQDTFHGVNLNSLKNAALDEVFHQPVVDTWHTGILMSKTIKWNFNFERDDAEALKRIEIPFELTALRTAYIHGICSWFDVGFMGSKRTFWLSTGPTEPLTHWYQVRCLLKVPLLAMEDQQVKGRLLMVANDKQSYDIDLEIEVNGQKQRNSMDLKMPHFRYTGQAVVPPPGHSAENPIEELNQTVVLNNSLHTKEYPFCDLLAEPIQTMNGV